MGIRKFFNDLKKYKKQLAIYTLITLPIFAILIIISNLFIFNNMNLDFVGILIGNIIIYLFCLLIYLFALIEWIAKLNNLIVMN
jgi:hypothetical protein